MSGAFERCFWSRGIVFYLSKEHSFYEVQLFSRVLSVLSVIGLMWLYVLGSNVV